MNYHDHAKNSATLFGGVPSDYEKIHELIDMNKVVSASIYGRFFLHHLDIGGAILEKVFGKTITNADHEKVAVKDILKQHLIEDYNDLPMFHDWTENLLVKVFTQNERPMKMNWEGFQSAVKKDPVLSKLKAEDIKQMESLLELRMFTKSKRILENRARYMVFNHALGIQLAEKVLGTHIGTSSIATVDAFKHFLLATFGSVRTLLDFEEHIRHKKWMEAPEGKKRTQAATTKERMAKCYVFTRISDEEKPLVAKVKDPGKIDFSKITEKPSAHANSFRRNNRGGSRKRRVFD